ncbi:uncharacterized protein N7500_006749 [Penicillium coprophilum]|uniref:uncharacterized protein n=1 Tax=Penicillium coprophilum TaxID=36646 RepID=UPI00238CB7F3|nr:uncharacterized protein N7500_006749 [Penicillium coprophilum]KAJ5164919.1 hypothetical protein N7500_006749 [Penicillium coprophilum]
MATQSIPEDCAQSTMSEQAEDPPEYHTIQRPRALIECIQTPSAPLRKPFLQSLRPAFSLSLMQSPLAPSGSSQAFKVNGMIYVAGQIGALPSGVLVTGQTATVERIFRNIEAILKAAGSSWDRVIKTTVYFKEYVHGKGKFEAHYQRVLPFAPPRTTIVVPRIESKGVITSAEIQMEVIAVE